MFQLDNAHNARITKAYLIHGDPLTQHVTTEHFWDQLGQRNSRRYRKPESRQLIMVALQKKIVDIYGTVNVDNGGISNMLMSRKLTTVKHVLLIFD